MGRDYDSRLDVALSELQSAIEDFIGFALSEGLTAVERYGEELRLSIEEVRRSKTVPPAGPAVNMTSYRDEVLRTPQRRGGAVVTPHEVALYDGKGTLLAGQVVSPQTTLCQGDSMEIHFTVTVN